MPKIHTAPVEVQNRVPRAAERRANRPANIDPVQAYSVDETCAALDVSRAQLYKLFAAGQVRAIRLDGRPRVTGAEIRRVTSVASQAAA